MRVSCSAGVGEQITCASGVMAVAVAVFVGRAQPASELVQSLSGLLLALVTYAAAYVALRLEEVLQLRAPVLGGERAAVKLPRVMALIASPI